MPVKKLYILRQAILEKANSVRTADGGVPESLERLSRMSAKMINSGVAPSALLKGTLTKTRWKCLGEQVEYSKVWLFWFNDGRCRQGRDRGKKYGPHETNFEN